MIRRIAASLMLGLIAVTITSSGAAARLPDVPIDHIIVIYQENHTFDNLYGEFPGANGLNAPGARVTQVNKLGLRYRTLPQPLNDGDPPVRSLPPGPDRRFPDDLPNAPFLIDRYAPPSQLTADPVHGFYQHQLQINGGKMNKFVAWTDAGGLPMGHYDTQKLPLYPYAREYTLADNFFTGAFGSTMLNHFWLVCACTPVWPNAPADMVARPLFNADGDPIGLIKDGEVTPDGHVVNDVQPFYRPYSRGVPADHRMPPQTMPTIGERLSGAGISWAWYDGGWDEAMAGKKHLGDHPALIYFKKYADGTAAKAEHFKDEKDFLASLDNSTLPAVSFISEIGAYDEHPGVSPISASQQHIVGLIDKVQHAPYWEKTAIIVSYDDYGGWYDHVAPPEGDRWGPGGGFPTLIISPHARKHFVDHTLYDTTSILRFIEWRHGLKPLTKRDAEANNMLAAFNFDRSDTTDEDSRAHKEPGGSGRIILQVVLLMIAAAGTILLWRRVSRS